jgi:hypothetical protein
MTASTPATTTNSVVNPTALAATFVRYVVPAIVGVLISLAAKAGFSLSATQAYAYVAPAVAAVYSTGIHLLEEKIPALSFLLGAKRPATVLKAKAVAAPATPAK